MGGGDLRQVERQDGVAVVALAPQEQRLQEEGRHRRQDDPVRPEHAPDGAGADNLSKILEIRNLCTAYVNDREFRVTGSGHYLHVRIGCVSDDGGEGFGDVVPVALVREQPILGDPVLGLGLPRAPHDGCQCASMAAGMPVWLQVWIASMDS